MNGALALINQMRANGVIGNYAIGGAVAATFYLEPAATLDVDVFVTLPGTSSAPVSLSPIYEYLTRRGGKAQGEYIVIGEWPVQFLTAADRLEQEAIDQAVATEVEGIPARVMTAEHLVAIALRTGRVKDRSRILQFLEQNALDREKLNHLVTRHGLLDKWQQFQRKHLGKADE